MDWDKLHTFNAAAETGSFTGAADALNLSTAAVARHVMLLEQDLETSLFHRHPRGLKMTEQGELLHKAVREISAQVSMAEALLAEHRAYPRGALKISTNMEFGAFWLAPRLKEFHELYPEVTPILLFDGGDADLSMREADVASPRVGGYFVYPAELRDSKRIAVFRDFLIYKLAEAGMHAAPLDRPVQAPHAGPRPPIPIGSISGTGRTSDASPRSVRC